MKVKLVEFTDELLDDKLALQTLADWRNSALHTFADPTPATVESTERWLRGSIFSDTHKHLYFVQESRFFVRPFIGHVGIVHSGMNPPELGYILRGRPESPGAMAEAIKVLIEKYRHLRLRVLPSNKHAISFYSRLGFQEVGVEGSFLVMHIFRSESLPPLVDLESELASGEWIWR